MVLSGKRAMGERMGGGLGPTTEVRQASRRVGANTPAQREGSLVTVKVVTSSKRKKKSTDF